MLYTDPHLVRTLQVILEFLGTFAFAISGIRHAAQKHFDWFGGYVCGFAVAIGGGTIRDTMLGVRPFWMTNIMYVLCTGLAPLLGYLVTTIGLNDLATHGLFSTRSAWPSSL